MDLSLKRRIFSFPSLSICLGVFGILSGVTGIYYKDMEPVPFWIFISAVWVFISISAILIKIIADGISRHVIVSPFESPISYKDELGSFLIHKNSSFVGQILVGCYLDDDGFDRLAYLGQINHIQEQVIQIKIIKDYEVLSEIPRTQTELRKIEIRPVVPIDALADFREA